MVGAPPRSGRGPRTRPDLVVVPDVETTMRLGESCLEGEAGEVGDEGASAAGMPLHG